MEYKFSSFKRPYLKDFVRDFFDNMDTDKNIEFEILDGDFFDRKVVCKLNSYDISFEDFFKCNSHLKVISVTVKPDNTYIIKCF